MKRKEHQRVWASLLLLLAATLTAQAQSLVNLELKDKPLPAALKLIEREGGKTLMNRMPLSSIQGLQKHSNPLSVRQEVQTYCQSAG